MRFTQSVSGTTYTFDGLVDLMAKATPLRSGDQLAGCAADSDAERAADVERTSTAAQIIRADRAVS